MDKKAGPFGSPARPVCYEQHDRCPVDWRHQRIEQLSRGGIYPVSVLDNNQHWTARGALHEPVDQRLQCEALSLLWCQVDLAVPIMAIEGQKLCINRSHRPNVRAHVGEHMLELVEPLLVAIARPKVGGAAEILNNRKQGTVGMVGRALKPQDDMRRRP